MLKVTAQSDVPKLHAVLRAIGLTPGNGVTSATITNVVIHPGGGDQVIDFGWIGDIDLGTCQVVAITGEPPVSGITLNGFPTTLTPGNYDIRNVTIRVRANGVQLINNEMTQFEQTAGALLAA